MTESKSYAGSCFCGAVQVRVAGEPVVMGYCHCESCRSWSASPVNAFALFRPSAASIVRGADELASYRKTERSERTWCKRCGGHLLTRHPLWDLTDVYAATVPALPFKAAVHVNYQERVLRIQDGLPKQRDVPKEMGGSGELLAE